MEFLHLSLQSSTFDTGGVRAIPSTRHAYSDLETPPCGIASTALLSRWGKA